jgi:NADP-dependent 3-hydroxy acid dehydrogenase YdfG
MAEGIENKVVVITGGGSSGLGDASLERLKSLARKLNLGDAAA